MGYGSQSALLKQEIEARLATRIPSALSPQAAQTPRLCASGVAPVDRLLGGGLPIGGISELTGSPSSGRTSLAFSLLAEASVESACAWVDVDDSLDPRSAAAAGVNLRNLLWIRLAAAAEQTVITRAKTFTPADLNLDGSRLTAHGRGNHHPRTETQGLAPALETMLAGKAEARLRKTEGTPGCPNRKLSLASAPEEQVRFEHHNARRADASDPIRQADHRAAAEARQRACAPVLVPAIMPKQTKSWTRLEQAVKAADQVMQSGGFRVVVLDLASVAPEQALRIPAATWFRFRRAAQESDAIFLLLTQVACARSSALCVLDCAAAIANSASPVLDTLSQTAEIVRQRQSSPFAKKAPGRVVSWEATPLWMRAAGR